MAKTSGISPDKIVEVAEAIIAFKGAKETTLKDIAKAVGISKGTLYYHYATKEALLYDIIGRHFDLVAQRMVKLAGRRQPRISPVTKKDERAYGSDSMQNSDSAQNSASAQNSYSAQTSHSAQKYREDREDLLALMLEDLGEQRQINRLHLTLVGEMLAGDEDMRRNYIERYRGWEQSVRSVLNKLFGEDHPATEMASSLLLTFVEGHAVRGTLLEEPGAYREMAGFITGLYVTEKQMEDITCRK